MTFGASCVTKNSYRKKETTAKVLVYYYVITFTKEMIPVITQPTGTFR